MTSLTRRGWLRLSIGGATAALLPAAAPAAPSPSPRRLVVVMLRGAVDGLSVVVPHGDPGYYAARAGIAIAPPGAAGGALPLDGRFGLHPALAPVLPLWRDGRLGFVQACGSPDPTRSHFDAQHQLEIGRVGRAAAATRDGWLNRLLGALAGDHGPLQGLAVGPTLPEILKGRMPVANLPLGEKPGALDRPGVADAFAALYRGDDPVSQAFRDGQQARREVMADLAEQQQADNGAPLPGGFPGDARRLAAVMARDPRVRVAFVALGGWDTHVGQGAAEGQLAGRLRPLGEGLAALAGGLGDAFRDTVVVVVSEFGRTVRQNGNGGTDHGHGGVMWLLGGPVAGGRVAGSWPGLAPDRLFEGRDLAVTTDYRAVLGAVLRRHLGLDAGALRTVLPDAPDGRALDGLIRA